MECRQLFGASPPLIAFFAMKVNCRQLKGENKGDSVPEIKKEHFFKIIKVTIPLNPPLHIRMCYLIKKTCKGGQSPDETQLVIQSALPFG